MVILSLSLPRTVPPGYRRVFSVHVLRGLVQRFSHRLWIIFVKGEKKLPRS